MASHAQSMALVAGISFYHRLQFRTLCIPCTHNRQRIAGLVFLGVRHHMGLSENLFGSKERRQVNVSLPSMEYETKAGKDVKSCTKKLD